jgi:DNA-binding transcriptional ArsR family regulator
MVAFVEALVEGIRWQMGSRVRVEHRAGQKSALASHDRKRYILNQMVQHMPTRLDASFAALSDATRRGVLERLGRADASITDLAEKFDMTLTGMKKHVSVLEQAGLVSTEKVGRVRTCKLGPRRLEDETAWIERYLQLWDARFDELDKVVEELKLKEKIDGRDKRK